MEAPGRLTYDAESASPLRIPAGGGIDCMIPPQDDLHRRASTATDGAADAAATPRVSVIVPVLRGDDNFRACLASMAGLDPPPAELVVAVDGGDASATALARAHGAVVVVLDRAGRAGRARNAAARVAGATCCSSWTPT